MKTKIVLNPIRYFELDERVNFQNFKGTALKVALEEDFIEAICNEFDNSPINLSRFFENVTTIPDYENWLEYVSNFWLEREFYYNVFEHLSKYKMDNHSGKICFLLLIFKKIQNVKQNQLEIDEQLQMDSEFGRFLNLILKYRDSDKHVSNMEITKGGVITSFVFGDYIFQNLLKIIDERFQNDFIGWTEFGRKFPFQELESDENPHKEDFDAYFRRYFFNKLEEIFRPIIKSKSKRSLLYNQLLSEANILDYKAFNLEKEQWNYSRERALVIDKIRDRLDYQLRK